MTHPLKKFNSNKKEFKNDEYYTPLWVLDSLRQQFRANFNLDPATTSDNAKRLGIPVWFTQKQNSLKTDWNKVLGDYTDWDIWINPPFTMKKEFIEKAVETINNGFAGYIYILVPDKSITNKYMTTLLKNIGFDLILPNGRISFIVNGVQTNSSYFGSVILRLGKNVKQEIFFLEDLENEKQNI